uniref:DUF5641 domain-containing protein n=1 Tax=Panagrellus redivivus TaxID=6233 RepID=A0A7E4VHJ3_PANRE
MALLTELWRDMAQTMRIWRVTHGVAAIDGIRKTLRIIDLDAQIGQVLKCKAFKKQEEKIASESGDDDADGDSGGWWSILAFQDETTSGRLERVPPSEATGCTFLSCCYCKPGDIDEDDDTLGDTTLPLKTRRINTVYKRQPLVEACGRTPSRATVDPAKCRPTD